MVKRLLKRIVPRSVIDSLSDGARFVHELENNLFLSMPNATKRAFVANAAKVLKYPVFIETGTFEGDMAAEAARCFRQVHTIELDDTLARRAQERFAGTENVRIHLGDSGKILAEVLGGIAESCVFWLDAHYSGGDTARGEADTPILAELDAIGVHGVRPHAVLIDDARVLGTDDAYPSLEDVIARLRRIDPGFRIGVSSDILWAAPIKLLDFRWIESTDGRAQQPTSRG
jgi:hypothetical protein